jgi:hypothetical protein
MRVAELHFRDDTLELDRAIDVELGCERMMRGGRRGGCGEGNGSRKTRMASFHR